MVSAPKMTTRLPVWQVLTLIGIVASVVRLPLAVLAPLVSPDGETSLRVASNILVNACISLSDPSTADCVPNWGGNHLPGYPMFIAGIWLLFGQSTLAVTAAQTVLVVLAGLRLAYAAHRLLGSNVAMLFVGLVVAASPIQIAWCRFILPDTLFLAAALWLFGELLLSYHHARVRTLPMAFAIMLGALVRFDGILLAIPAIVCAFQLHVWPLALKKITVAALIVATPITAFVARNVAHDLPLIPQTGMHDGSPPPSGYLAWGNTWIETIYDGGAMFYPVAQYRYDAIEIPSKAYASSAEEREVAHLLAQLRQHAGQPFPGNVDQAFADLATQKRAADPLRYYGSLPLKRVGVFWLQPFASFGWPLELAAWLTTQELDRFRTGTLKERVQVLLHHPLLVVGKILVFVYRLALVTAFAGTVSWLIWRSDRTMLRILPAFLAYALLRTVLLAYQTSIDPRYTVTSMAAVEVFLAVALCHLWMMRQPARAPASTA